jgi:hypothetical protein
MAIKVNANRVTVKPNKEQIKSLVKRMGGNQSMSLAKNKFHNFRLRDSGVNFYHFKFSSKHNSDQRTFDPRTTLKEPIYEQYRTN